MTTSFAVGPSSGVRFKNFKNAWTSQENIKNCGYHQEPLWEKNQMCEHVGKNSKQNYSAQNKTLQMEINIKVKKFRIT